jgi:hypothetical protein
VPRRTSHCQSAATYGQRSDLRCVMASGTPIGNACAPQEHGNGAPERDCGIRISSDHGAASKKIAQIYAQGRAPTETTLHGEASDVT